MQLSSKLKDFVVGPNGMAIGTRDAEFNPEYARVVGIQVVDDEHVKLLIAKKTGDRTIKNINDNKLIAVVIANILSSECYQFKGRVVKYAEANDEDQGVVDSYLEFMNEGAVKMGLNDQCVYNFPHNPVWAIEMRVEEIFEQTPKIGTGQKLEA